MDLSKLPHQSPDKNLEDAAPIKSRPPLIEPISYGVVPARSIPLAAEAWFSIIVGVICLLLGRTFLHCLATRIIGGPFHTGVDWTVGPLEGQEVSYGDLQGFTMLSDAALVAFGIALLIDGALLIFASRQRNLRSAVSRFVMPIAIAVCAAATIFNGYVASKMLGENIMPLLHLLAVAFGGYLTIQHFAQFRRLQIARQRQNLAT